MSGTIFKALRHIIPMGYFLAASLFVYAQDNEITRHLKLALGGGYGYFINPFTNVLDNKAVINRPAFSAKLVWQPEHRLRVGLESGYYCIYSTTLSQNHANTEVLTTNLNVVPIFMSFSMKIVNHFEINFASGWASMIYSIEDNNSKKNISESHFYSMSNFSTGCSYYLPLGEKIDLGAEFKYMYLGKTDDMYLSILVNLSYKIITWKKKVTSGL
jgi:hypothetical protein